MQALDSEFEIAMPPLRGTAPRDAHGGGHVGDRLAGLDALAQQQSTGRGERSVTVSHEDLRCGVSLQTAAHLQPGVFALVDPYRVTNVRDGNS